MNKILRALGVIASLALLVGLAPSATADHSTGWPNGAAHENIPVKPVAVIDTPLGTCVVNGIVTTLGDGDDEGKPDKDDPEFMELTPAHSHYAFQDTELVCVAVPDTPGDNYDGTYAVGAWGGADGPCQVDPNGGSTPPDCPAGFKHGSTTAISWSHSGGAPGVAGTSKDDPGGGYNFAAACGDTPGTIANKNSITADRDPSQGPKSGDGWMKFSRVGSDADAWGQFCTDDLDGVKFTADLIFTRVIDPATGEPVPNLFNLNGTAIIFCGDFVPSNAKGAKAPCPK